MFTYVCAYICICISYIYFVNINKVHEQLSHREGISANKHFKSNSVNPNTNLNANKISHLINKRKSKQG